MNVNDFKCQVAMHIFPKLLSLFRLSFSRYKAAPYTELWIKIAHPAEDGSAVLAGLLDALLVAAVGAHDFGDVVPLEDVVLVRVVAEAALVGLPAARGLKKNSKFQFYSNCDSESVNWIRNRQGISHS